MSILTMTPCYSILLSLLALALIAIIVGPLVYLILLKTWEAIDATYVRIKKHRDR